MIRKRLDEEFHFAHCSGNGIVSVALEMKLTGECDKECPNIVQYVLFPPHKRITDDKVTWQLVTECWIEPQQGRSINCAAGHKHLENKDFKNIAASVSPNDRFDSGTTWKDCVFSCRIIINFCTLNLRFGRFGAVFSASQSKHCSNMLPDLPTILLRLKDDHTFKSFCRNLFLTSSDNLSLFSKAFHFIVLLENYKRWSV